MNSFLWIFVAFCTMTYVFIRFAAADRVVATPEQRRRDFIVDVCDGDRRKAERLVAEKHALFPQLNDSQATAGVSGHARHHGGRTRCGARGNQASCPQSDDRKNGRMISLWHQEAG